MACGYNPSGCATACCPVLSTCLRDGSMYVKWWGRAIPTAAFKVQLPRPLFSLSLSNQECELSTQRIDDIQLRCSQKKGTCSIELVITGCSCDVQYMWPVERAKWKGVVSGLVTYVLVY
eukprot:1193847-Prorocentrum_minimum.AAC.6